MASNGGECPQESRRPRRVLLLFQPRQHTPIASDRPVNARAQVTALVQMLADQHNCTLSHAQLAPMIQALVEDIEAGADGQTRKIQG
jgi:hypothetical protein